MLNILYRIRQAALETVPKSCRRIQVQAVSDCLGVGKHCGCVCTLSPIMSICLATALFRRSTSSTGYWCASGLYSLVQGQVSSWPHAFIVSSSLYGPTSFPTCIFTRGSQAISIHLQLLHLPTSTATAGSCFDRSSHDRKTPGIHVGVLPAASLNSGVCGIPIGFHWLAQLVGCMLCYMLIIP